MEIRILKNTVVFIVAILFSCNNVTHEEYYSFNNKGWGSDSIVKFQYFISDTTKTYDMSLKIRHTIDYDFQNLFIFLGSKTNDTIEVFLSNKKGEWLGRGVSDIREVEYVFQREKRFLKSGEHYLKVEQAMRYGDLERIENLQHILDIGLIISENNEQNK